jgi:hypothetical protein
VVKELLPVDGYTVEALSKKTLPGFADADMRAVRDERFDELRSIRDLSTAQPNTSC